MAMIIPNFYYFCCAAVVFMKQLFDSFNILDLSNKTRKDNKSTDHSSIVIIATSTSDERIHSFDSMLTIHSSILAKDWS